MRAKPGHTVSGRGKWSRRAFVNRNFRQTDTTRSFDRPCADLCSWRRQRLAEPFRLAAPVQAHLPFELNAGFGANSGNPDTSAEPGNRCCEVRAGRRCMDRRKVRGCGQGLARPQQPERRCRCAVQSGAGLQAGPGRAQGHDQGRGDVWQGRPSRPCARGRQLRHPAVPDQPPAGCHAMAGIRRRSRRAAGDVCAWRRLLQWRLRAEGLGTRLCPDQPRGSHWPAASGDQPCHDE